MKIKEFFFLLGRNMKGVFTRPFEWTSSAPHYNDFFYEGRPRKNIAGKDNAIQENPLFIDGYGAVFLILIHFGTSLVTVPLFGLIKTLLDCFTRKNVPAEQLAQSSNKIDKLEEKELDDLVDTMLAYHPKSNSSRAILEELRREDAEKVDRLVFEAHERKKRDIETQKREAIIVAAKQKTAQFDKEIDFKITIIPKVRLNEEDLKTLEQFDRQNKLDILREQRATKKRTIKDYVTDSKNEGKKLQQLIFKKIYPSKREMEHPLLDAHRP